VKTRDDQYRQLKQPTWQLDFKWGKIKQTDKSDAIKNQKTTKNNKNNKNNKQTNTHKQKGYGPNHVDGETRCVSDSTMSNMPSLMASAT
jgi:hypothetical protein